MTDNYRILSAAWYAQLDQDERAATDELLEQLVAGVKNLGERRNGRPQPFSREYALELLGVLYFHLKEKRIKNATR